MDDFHRKYGWGYLQDHMQKCDECNGTGYYDETQEEECSSCNGEKQLFWGSFYTQDVSYCEYCKKDNVPIASMYAHGYDEYVCLVCYINHHKQNCGCNLWVKPESCIVFK